MGLTLTALWIAEILNGQNSVLVSRQSASVFQDMKKELLLRETNAVASG